MTTAQILDPAMNAAPYIAEYVELMGRLI